MTRRHPPSRRRRPRRRRTTLGTSRRAPVGTAPAQAAAWDAYRAVTTGLLPALRGADVDRQAVKTQLGAVALRIVGSARLWGEAGVMLVAALHCAMGLYCRGDHDDLAGLAQDVSQRLYTLSRQPASPGQRPDDRDDPVPP